MQSIILLYGAIFLFIGYALGRIGHILGGHLNMLHHWLYGAVLILIGIKFYLNLFGIFLFCFGVGVFVSDFYDFLNLRFLGRDKNHEKIFFGFD